MNPLLVITAVIVVLIIVLIRFVMQLAGQVCNEVTSGAAKAVTAIVGTSVVIELIARYSATIKNE